MIYKIVVDIGLINLNKLISDFVTKGCEICLDGDGFFIYKATDGHQFAPLMILRKNKIRNYFLKEITQPPTKTPTNYIQTWLLEKFNELEMVKFNEQNQALLKKAQENINKAKAEFAKLVEQYNQQNKEARTDGGSNN